MENNDECSSELLEKKLTTTQTYASGIYGALGTLSRVGDEYQTEIPLKLTKSEYRNYIKNPIEEETNGGLPSDFLIGLAIPISWINRKVYDDPTADVSLVKSQLCVIPGCILNAWTEIEKGSFLLGLYIFGKDFVRLKRFIESKNMGDIMSYYYSRCDEYRKWSECRKNRGRKCIMGARIFSGVRLQELLCRLIPNVSEEQQNALLEVARTFVDKRITLEQYVFSLRDSVGLKHFVNAVAIGSGKLDITGNHIEPTKQNQAIHIRPEIPIGKACSSLNSTEIIQFLTGDYRLSKARSNDLFWEAVWPRLLARGWHSEQPNGYNYAANKNPLVFLIPGVKKFSRKLVKGDAYFDSVSDVLTKVGSDPQLLELEDGEENGETGVKMEVEDDDEEEENGFLEKRKSHCYLQPRGLSVNGVMKLIVVDTSGGKVTTIQEVDPTKLVAKTHSDELHSELVSSDESDIIANTFPVEENTTRKTVKKQKSFDERKLPEKKRLKTVSNGSDSKLPEPSKKLTKANSSRKLKHENSGHNPGHHAKRRRRLTACSRVDSNLEKDTDDITENIGSSSHANTNNNNNKLSSNLSFSSRCSSIDTVDEQLIDLNFPHITPESGNGETVEVKEERKDVVIPKEQENGVSRRQSTRNRPPTVKALEAIANGFLAVNTRKKGKEENFSTSTTPRSRSLRGEVAVISESSTGDASSGVKGDDENGPCNGEIERR